MPGTSASESGKMGLDLSASASNNFSVEAIMMKKENCDNFVPNDLKFLEDIQKKFGFKVSPDIFTSIRQMKPLNF